jgi:hypothetical protein
MKAHLWLACILFLAFLAHSILGDKIQVEVFDIDELSLLKVRTLPVKTSTFQAPSPSSPQKRQIEPRASTTFTSNPTNTLYSTLYCLFNNTVYVPCLNSTPLFDTTIYHTHRLIYNPQTNNYFGLQVASNPNGGTDLNAFLLNPDGTLITVNTLFSASNFTAVKNQPLATISLLHQHYFIIFGYGVVMGDSLNDSPMLIYGFVSFKGILQNYTMVNLSGFGVTPKDLVYNSVRDEYITTFAAVNQTYGLDVGLMAVSPNGTLTQSGTIGDYFASLSDFSISISDNGQYYIGLMDLSGTNFQDLLLLNITAYPFNITGQYLMSWTLEIPGQGAIQLNIEDPFLINTPYTDDYLLVAEAQAASVGYFQIIGTYIAQDGTPAANIYPLSPGDNNLYQEPTLTVMGSSALVAYEQVNTNQITTGMFTIFDLSTFNPLEIWILDTVPSFYPYAAYNTNNTNFLLLWENYNPPSSPGAQSSMMPHLSAGAIAGIVIAVAVGIIGVIVVIVILGYMSLKYGKGRGRSSSTQRLEEDDQK